MADASAAPIYSSYSTLVGAGIVGGYMFKIGDVSRQAAGVVQKILDGEKLTQEEMPPPVSPYYIVDWRQLQRWHFSEAYLPAGTIVFFREVAPWQRYKLYIIGGLSLIAVEMLLIIGLLSQRAKRRRVETNLAVSNDRFRLAVQASKSVGWEWDVKTGRDRWFGDLQAMFGMASDSYDGDVEDFRRRVHPEDRELVWKGLADAGHNHKPYAAEFRVVRLDGAVRWVTATGQFYYGANRDPERMLGMAADITERKQAEESLRESEDKLRLLLDSTAEAIYGIDLEGRCTFCNFACLRVLRYERAENLLGKKMHDLIHHTRENGTLFPAEECRIVQSVRSGGGVHVDDEVLWRSNGTSFPAEYWSYPQRKGQEIVGAVVAFLDITDRKLAEAVLANVSRKLIAAQEQERTRIARELHDDIGQRVALLALRLEQLQQDSLDLSAAEARTRMSDLHSEASDIASDIQSLSHELHSSKLEYLGIAAAMRGFCREFGEQQNVEIDFRSHDLPSPLSSEISLCLFRVLQEALHNSAKHSGAGQFEVRLWGETDEIHLMVKDSGVGFDTEAAKENRGLGLISMQERLKLLNGTFSIQSQPKRGTTIHARVPLNSGSDSMQAAG